MTIWKQSTTRLTLITSSHSFRPGDVITTKPHESSLAPPVGLSGNWSAGVVYNRDLYEVAEPLYGKPFLDHEGTDPEQFRSPHVHQSTCSVRSIICHTVTCVYWPSLARHAVSVGCTECWRPRQRPDGRERSIDIVSNLSLASLNWSPKNCIRRFEPLAFIPLIIISGATSFKYDLPSTSPQSHCCKTCSMQTL